jgi:N6-adenosine-specific RNA methylase IME4
MRTKPKSGAEQPLVKQRNTNQPTPSRPRQPLFQWLDVPDTPIPATPSIPVSASVDLQNFASGRRFGTILADPPWRFTNRTGKMAPEHRRLSRYGTLTMGEIAALPISAVAAQTAHLYLWVPNALLPDGLQVMSAWGFQYKTNIVWHKLRRDGGSDGRGVGFYFRNVTELILFGIRGKNARTLRPGRRQVNYLGTRKREHSRKPDEQYEIIEACSPGPWLEVFARGKRDGWQSWGDEAIDDYQPTWSTYDHNSATDRRLLRA